jgi:hypothetical protein
LIPTKDINKIPFSNLRAKKNLNRWTEKYFWQMSQPVGGSLGSIKEDLLKMKFEQQSRRKYRTSLNIIIFAEHFKENVVYELYTLLYILVEMKMLFTQKTIFCDSAKVTLLCVPNELESCYVL